MYITHKTGTETPPDDPKLPEETKYPQNAKEFQALSEAYPDGFRIDEDSVYFMTWFDADIITCTNSKFHLQRQEGHEEYGFIFTPEEDGKYVVSVIQMMEQIYETDVVYDLLIDGLEPHGHFHYFYPRIINYVVTVKNGEISAQRKGEREFLNKDNIDNLKREGCFGDYVEMDTDDILENDNTYYSFAAGQFLENYYFMYFDYAYEYGSRTDHSEFFMIDDNEYFNVSGNGRITKSGGCAGYFDGNLMEGTCDENLFYVISSEKNGMVEIATASEDRMGLTYILTVENGQFIPDIQQFGDVLPETGDLSFDGRIGISDVVLLQKFILADTDLTDMQYQIADMNNDRQVNVFDLVGLKKAVLLDR